MEDMSVEAVSRIVTTLPEHLMESVIGSTASAVRKAALRRGLGVVERHLDLVLRDMVASGLGGACRRYGPCDVPEAELFEYDLAHDMAYGLYDIFVRGIEDHMQGGRSRKYRNPVHEESSESD